MRISFRQGIVSAPPGFLQSSGSSVTLSLSQPDSVVVAFADGQSNYLHTERVLVDDAWAGPFTSGTDYWLYWDIDIRTGVRTFGHTLLEPITSSSAPGSPGNGQHWFDTVAHKIKVWNATAGSWIPKIRVFAGKYASGATFVSMGDDFPDFTGTQVGDLTAVNAGAIVFDVNGDPVKRGSAFFTTEDVVTTSVASTAQIKLSAITIEAVAVASIPAYSLVRFVDFNQINLATSVITANGAYGMIEVDAAPGDVVYVTMQGLVTSLDWDWNAAGVNALLYVNGSGQLTPMSSGEPIVVATVVDKNTVLLRSSLTTVGVSGGGSGITIKEQGIVFQTGITSIDFQGPFVSVGSDGPGGVLVNSDQQAPRYQEFVVATVSQSIVNTTLSTRAKTSTTSFLQVFVNGIFQQEGATKAYTVTGPTQLTFAPPLQQNDDVVIYSYNFV